MTLGLAITGLVAYSISQNAELVERFIFDMFWLPLVLLFGAILLSGFLSRRIWQLSTGVAVLLFVLYTVLIGVVLSTIFIVFELGSIFAAFFMTGGMFAVMSIIGYTTKTDLTAMGGYLIMGVVGIIIASVVNIILRSEIFSYIISYVTVFVFLGLTAYDTQKIKRISQQNSASIDEQGYIRWSLLGALIFYIDFLNIFLSLLRIFGRRN